MIRGRDTVLGTHRVVRHQVDEVDYVRDTMIIDVRYRTPSARTRLAGPEPTMTTAVAP